MKNNYFTQKISLLNVVLTILIVILHAKTPERFGLILDQTYPFIYSIYTITLLGVPMFFFVSAVLFYKQCTFVSIKEKFLRRIKSLLIPYLLWNTLFVLIYVILLNLPFFQANMNMEEALLDSPKEIINAILTSRCTPLWFVKDLMFFTIMAPIILLFIQNIYGAFILLFLSIYLACSNDFGYESVFVWLPVYLQGAILGYWSFREGYYKSLDTYIKNPKVRLLIAIALIVVLLFLYISLYYKENLIKLFRYLAPLLFWTIFDFTMKDIITYKFKIKPWMSYTFIIYCTHHFILNVLQKIVVILYNPSRLVLNLTFIFSPIVTIFIIIFISKFLSKLSFYKYLSGGR